VAVVQDPVDQRRRHALVAEDLAPFLEALLLVSTVEARSSRWLISWKKSIAPVRLIGRQPASG
jgi:hypothetical protein